MENQSRCFKCLSRNDCSRHEELCGEMVCHQFVLDPVQAELHTLRDHNFKLMGNLCHRLSQLEEAELALELYHNVSPTLGGLRVADRRYNQYMSDYHPGKEV